MVNSRFSYANAPASVESDEEIVAGGHMTPEDLKAIVELFEIFCRWDEEARANADKGGLEELATLEPVKGVSSGK